MDKLPKLRKWLVRIAIGLAVFIPIYFALAGLGSKLGLWDWRFGFKLMTNYGPKLLKVAAALAAIGLALSLYTKHKKSIALSVIALVVPAALMTYGHSLRKHARSVPPIHDITTDTQDPPTFTSTILELRGEASNPVNYTGKTYGKDGELVSVAQVRAYPDVRTIVLAENPADTFENALSIVNEMGWELHSQSEATGIIEGTDTTFWFGFKDDVVIRIRPSDTGGSLVDVRSISRVGGSDVGANAKRIRAFSQKLSN